MDRSGLPSGPAPGLLADLRAGLPDDAVLVDPDQLASYRHDMARFAEAGTPAVLVLPRSTAEVAHTLRTATAHRVPVVPRGAGSGLSGGANAVDGAIVLATTRMDRILEIDPANRLVVTQPGVLNATLSAAVAEHGLCYPPDPSSWQFCSIGGNLSTNAGGLCCVKYGVTAEYVLGLEVVLADGSVLRTGRRTVKGVAGYDLTRLLVGSEGTLGVITEATLSLRPATATPMTMVATFDTTAAGGQAVAGIIRAGLVPSLLEIMDRASIRAVNGFRHLGLEECALMLLAQSDAGPVAAEEILAIEKICGEAGATATYVAADAEEGEMLLEARRAVILALDEIGTVVVDDVCVPRTRLAEFLDGVEAISTAHDVLIAVIAHAGDGNTHPNVVFDPAAPGARERAWAAYGAVMDLGLELGGTITGEHGVGLLKRPWLERELGPVGVRVHAAIKDALDPLGILNPGKVLDFEALRAGRSGG